MVWEELDQGRAIHTATDFSSPPHGSPQTLVKRCQVRHVAISANPHVGVASRAAGSSVDGTQAAAVFCGCWKVFRSAQSNFKYVQKFIQRDLWISCNLSQQNSSDQNKIILFKKISYWAHFNNLTYVIFVYIFQYGHVAQKKAKCTSFFKPTNVFLKLNVIMKIPVLQYYHVIDLHNTFINISWPW